MTNIHSGPGTAHESSEARTNFDEQFRRREKFNVAGGMVEVVDITPEVLMDETPILIAPAWGYTIDVYELTLRSLVEKGRRVLCLSTPRHGDDLEAMVKGGKGLIPPSEELRKALNILGVLDHKGLKDVQVFAHSEGAVNATIAALLDASGEKRITDLVLFAPAGLIGRDSLGRLLRGFSDLSRPQSLSKHSPKTKQTHEGWPDIPVTEAERMILRRTLRVGAQYVAQNPKRAFKEIAELSSMQTDEFLRDLQEAGVGVVVMAGVDDPVFPMERMQRQVHATTDADGNRPMVDGFLSVRGGHYGEPAIHPEHYAGVVDQMFRAQKRNKSERDEDLRKTG